MSRLLDANGFPVFEKPDLEVFAFSPTSADFHMMLRKMQRDQGSISDREMALAEKIAGPSAQKSERTIFNPFTGEVRRERIRLETYNKSRRGWEPGLPSEILE